MANKLTMKSLLDDPHARRFGDQLRIRPSAVERVLRLVNDPVAATRLVDARSCMTAPHSPPWYESLRLTRCSERRRRMTRGFGSSAV